ncbi:COG1470 family protein [Halobellus rubicundus]|uniref:DUF4352 domain-containing protein n=1 Tax=Halobellus rubicundus TaxID=2996466 RepID=A0ABD5MB27_9EURY
MKRREVITGTSLALLAGCLGDSQSEEETEDTAENTPTPSPIETSTPTRSSTPTSLKPVVSNVNLVSEWQEFGDVTARSIEGAGRGASIVIGYRYSVQVHDGEHDITKQARIFDSSGTRVAQTSSEDQQLVDGEGYQEWEGAFDFETEGWDLGEYEAEVIIKDNISGKVSSKTIGEFSLNSPLGDGEAKLISYSGPESLQPDESYSYSLELENTANRDSSIVSTLSVKRDRSEWYTYEDTQFELTIPAGETRTRESGTVTAPSDSGEYTFRIDDIGEVWSFEVV